MSMPNPYTSHVLAESLLAARRGSEAHELHRYEWHARIRPRSPIQRLRRAMRRAA